jgi:predicted nucleic-acid-binding Zn-ribbon protein
MSNTPNKNSQKLGNTLFQLKEQATTGGAWQRLFRAREREGLERTRRRLHTTEWVNNTKNLVIRCAKCGEIVEKISP